MLILVALNLAWRTIRYLLDFPMWGDEAFVAVNFLDHGFADMLKPLDHGMVAPLGFMWLDLLVSKLLGLGELALRLVPFLAGTVGMILFATFGRCVLDRCSSLAAIAILAASYYPLRHSTEVKPYSLDLLMALCVLWPAWRVWLQPDRTGRWVLLAIACILSVWFSYPVVFVAAGALVFLAHAVRTRRSRSVTVAWLVTGAMLTGSFVAMYLLVGSGQAQITEEYLVSNTWHSSFPPFKRPWHLPLWFLDVHTGNMFAYPVGGRQGGSTLTFLMVCFGIVTLWKRNRPLLALLIAPFVLSFIAAALQKYPYGGSARVSLHLAPSICLLAGAGLPAIFRLFGSPRKAVETMRVVPVVMGVLILIGTGLDIATPYKRRSDELCREIVRTIASEVGPADRFIVFGRFGEKPGQPDFITYGGSAARLRYYLELALPVEVHWEPDLEQWPADDRAGTIWLLAYRDNKVPFPDDEFQVYRQPLHERLGEPETRTFDLHDRNEEIVLHRFQASPP